ncbi:transketolase family protein [Roseomonas sp. OT10]|uniref:transketolase family protein n=1 Tax=Roseomonas cutis TaxID=2897332 RepID=UPI001E4DFB39|nr:transketolase C-terminal domain-containing protein [Roseomonas sp. OT10]UFN48399.1 transketolase family protein [Roseomonas sp. OT10]
MRAPITIAQSAAVWRDGTPTASKAYGRALLDLALSDPRIVCLGADLTGPTETDLFRDRLHERFFNLGVAEANLMCVASGMARSGDIPFVNTFGVFASRRAFDQVTLQIAYPRANVKLVGFMPGLTSPGGPTHQATDDIALMRALPGMVVMEPACASHVAPMLAAMAAHEGPAYMRIKRGDLPLLFEAESMPPIGKGQVVRRGRDGWILASGVMVALALEALDILSAQGIQAGLVNLPTIKPLDAALVGALAAEGRPLLVAENHSVIGGLGSAVAEVIAESGHAARFARLGVADVFAEGASAPYLFEMYGLSPAAIARRFAALV